MNISIIGKGSWGNAIVSLLTHNHISYSVAGREKKVKADVIFLAIPTESIGEALTYIQHSPDTIIINTSKGLQKETGKLPNQLVSDIFGDSVHYFSLLGPGFANQLVAKNFTIANLGYKKKDKYELVKNLIQTSYFKVIETPHIESIEIVAAFKNIYAIATGIAHGLNYKENTQTAFILLAIQEIYSILNTLHLTYDNSILTELYGDIMLTCTSMESRNYKFGILLVNKFVNDALKELKTVEGYQTSQYIELFQKQHAIHLPLASLVQHIITQNNPQNVKEGVDNFIKKI